MREVGRKLYEAEGILVKDFKYSDDNCWNYTFTIDEKRPRFVDVNCVNDSGELIYSNIVPFIGDVFIWEMGKGRADLVTKEAKEYCEKSVKSYMKLKAFW